GQRSSGQSLPAWPAGSEGCCDMGCVPALQCSVEGVRVPGCCGGGCTAVTPVPSSSGAGRPHAPQVLVRQRCPDLAQRGRTPGQWPCQGRVRGVSGTVPILIA